MKSLTKNECKREEKYKITQLVVNGSSMKILVLLTVAYLKLFITF